MKQYDTVVVGAGLSGLTAAYSLKKNCPNMSILVMERSDAAGGLTGNWLDQRSAKPRKLQPPMHMIFRDKYPNLISLVDEIGGKISELFPGFTIIDGTGERHRLELKDWTADHLPAPLHALGMFMKLKMSLRDKWDMAKLASVAAYCARELIAGKQEPDLVPNTMSLESLELLLGMGQRSRNFIETVTPSIYNTHPWYTSAPRMAAVAAGTLVSNRDSLKHHVFAKNYNAAFVDDFVAVMKKMGIDFLFNAEVMKLHSNDGKKIDEIYYIDNCGRQVYVCSCCGAYNHTQFVGSGMCSRCGKNNLASLIRQERIKWPIDVSSVFSGTCQTIKADNVITAMYPHMISKLIADDSPLLENPYVRSCFSMRLNQTRLSIARIYYDKHVSEDKHITGTHNPTFSFNGCQWVSNVFGAEDLGHEGGVIDVLLDVGAIHDSIPRAERKRQILRDIERVYPDARVNDVSHFSYADMHPSVLYHTEQPAIAGEHRFFNGNRIMKNWYVAGCHSGTIGIGMESAVQSGLKTANDLLEDEGMDRSVEVIDYKISAGASLLAKFGKGLLWWKLGGRDPRREG